MRIRLAAMGAVLILVAAADQRDKLIGKWQPAGAKDEGESWALETVGDALRISHSVKQKTEAIECNIMGKDCEVKLGGHKAKVSMWFNGDMLVEMETRGAEVVKRRFKVAGDDTMKMEVMPIVPEGKTETLEFKRVGMEAAR
jgi:hypothetical protein